MQYTTQYSKVKQCKWSLFPPCFEHLLCQNVGEEDTPPYFTLHSSYFTFGYFTPYTQNFTFYTAPFT